MKIDPRIRAELLKMHPNRAQAVNTYVRFLTSAPSPSRGNQFDGHHMLPRNWFPQYADARSFPWNVRTLVTRDHTRAHRFLNKIKILRRPDGRIKKTMTGFRLRPDQTENLKWLVAQDKEASISSLIRRAVDEFIERHLKGKK